MIYPVQITIAYNYYYVNLVISFNNIIYIITNNKNIMNVDMGSF